jgi:hypothetical protein
MGLLAIGRSGDWQIDLDELVGVGQGKRSWGLTIANRTFCVQLELKRSEALFELMELLNIEREGVSQVCFGSWAGADAWFVRERGRIQIRLIASREGNSPNFPPLVELNFHDEEITGFTNALHDLIQEMGNDFPIRK